MTELLIPILAFVVVMTIGGAILAFYGQRRSRQPRFGLDTEMDVSLDPGDERTSDRRSRPLRALTTLGRALSLGKVSVSLKEGLARAGYHHDSAAMTYLGAKLILLLIGAVGGLLLIIPLDLDTWKKAYLIGAVPVLLFFLPNLVMRILRQRN